MVTLYFEKLSVTSFLSLLLADGAARAALMRRAAEVLYIDESRGGARVLRPLLRMVGIATEQCRFEMRNVKDERGELMRLRIFRHDLFELRGRILASDEFRSLDAGRWDVDGVRALIEKGVIDGQIMEPHSVSRLAYLVSIVKWHAAATYRTVPLLVVERRPWARVLGHYGREQGVPVVFTPRLDTLSRGRLAQVRYRFPRIYALLRAVQDYGWPERRRTPRDGRARIYVEGRGEVRLRNDGYHSDFYWLLNSSCPAGNVSYRARSRAEVTALVDAGVSVTELHLEPLLCRSGMVPTGVHGPRRLWLEKRLLQDMLESYNAIRTFWRAVFESNDVKIFLTWYRFERSHIAIGDAVGELGGVSVCLPISFDGYTSADLMSKLDVVFCYSPFAAEIDRRSGAKSDYRIVTGYPRDYAAPLLRAEAQRLRERLEAAGARKIVFVIDENSVDDSRWHTGHELQRENYSHILEQVLATPWLGVVFKPKIARTLRHRLGPIADLLRAAEQTGRCYVYEATGRDVTSAPPLLAGLAADVCIHAHLCSGTAALECALAGLPTLLIDREGMPDSKLYELPRGTVIFQSWPEAMAALIQHFESPNGIPGFGDWSVVIDQLDPFRDGLAAQRIGDYLAWLTEAFERGLDRDAAMAQASGRYAAMWGGDKVICGDSVAARREQAAVPVPRAAAIA